MKDKLARPITGLLIGLITGILYGLITANINPIIYREFRIYYHAGEALLAVAQAGLTVAVLGMLAGLKESSYQGVIISATVCATGVVISGVQLDSAEKMVSTALLTLYGFLPLVVLFIPLSAMLRWSANLIQTHAEISLSKWQRNKGVVILLFLAMVVASFSVYPQEARLALSRMQGLIEQTQLSSNDETPYFFKDMVPIIKNAGQAYSLSWSNDITSFPMGNGSESLTATSVTMSMVTARFEAGEAIACLFRTDGALQLCAVIE